MGERPALRRRRAEPEARTSCCGRENTAEGGIAQGGSSVINSGTISGAGTGITTAYVFNSETQVLEGLAIGTTVENSGSIIGDTNDGVRLIGGGRVAPRYVSPEGDEVLQRLH